MNSITQIITHFFLFSLAFGTQLFGPVVSTKLTGEGFYKLGTSIMLSCLVLALGADYIMKPGLSSIECAGYLSLIILNSITLIFHSDEKSCVMLVIYALQVTTYTTLTFYIFNYNPLWIM